ncbi:MAG: glycosyltransferase [Erysipelothrix sp.]|jgi:glycosyltransferase involved in cell wall biosynthesis|nr:glycosyltransferase [Erysipelothrix sp.]
MNIALFTDTCFPQVNGVSNTVDMMVKHLTLLGHHVHLFAPEYSQPQPIYQNITTFKSTSLWFYPDMVICHRDDRLVRSVLQQFKPDVIHVMSELTCGWMGRRAAQELNIPLFTTFTTHIVEYAKLHNVGFLSSIIWKYFKYFHKPARQVLTPSQVMINELRQQKIYHASLFQRGVDTSMYHPKYKSTIINGIDLSQYDTTFLYVGRLSKEKNIEILLRSFEALCQSLPSSMALFIVGDGPAKSLYQELANEHVHFIGFQDKHNLAKWYASVDAFVFPSMSETFGNVILEAMASNTIVVGAKQGGVGCILNNENGIAIDMRSFDELFAIMKHIALKKIKVKSYQNGMQKTLIKYDWNFVLNQLICKYENSINLSLGHTKVRHKKHSFDY